MTFQGMPKADLWVHCPYNVDHRMKPSRLDAHVGTCEDATSSDILVCPFNTRHRFHKVLMAAHISECQWAASLHLGMMERQPLEYDSKVPKEEDGQTQISQVAKLAGRMGALGIDLDCSIRQPVAVTQQPTDQEEDPEWANNPKNCYICPGLDKEPLPKEISFNSYHYAMMKPAERKKLNQQRVIETKARKAAAQAKELAENLARQLQEEEDLLSAEKEECKCLLAKEKEKKKAAQERLKVAKLAAFLEKQAKKEID